MVQSTHRDPALGHEGMLERERDPEGYRPQDRTLDVALAGRSIPDDGGIGPALAHGLDRVVPRAAGDGGLDAGHATDRRSQQAAQDELGHRAHPEPELITLPLPGGADLVFGASGLGEDDPGPSHKHGSGGSQVAPPGPAIEQHDAQFPLQQPDLLGERRGSDVQPGRGTGELAFLDHCWEVPQLPQLHGDH